MSHEVLPFENGNIRGIDSNSLLRMYDQAQGAFNKSASQGGRAIADRAIQRITKELQRRKVPF
jgi:hypothetical protein